MSAINFNPEGVLINNETVINAPYNEDFELSHNLFSSVDFQIKVGDTVLTPQTDYILTNRYERAATEMGLYNIYQRVRILNNTYSGSTLSIRYRAVGDFVDADKMQDQAGYDERYLRRSLNLEDCLNKQEALGNLESSAYETTDASNFGYDSQNDESLSDVHVQTNWGGAIPMKVPFKEFAEEAVATSKALIASSLGITITESGGTITERSFDGDVKTIRPNEYSDADSIVRVSNGKTETALCSQGIPQGNYSSYWVMTTGNNGQNTQIAINHAGDGSANEIWFRHGHFSGSIPYWDNWQRLPTMDDVTSITAKYITSSAAGAAFADEAALSKTKYYAGQVISASTNPKLGDNDYCIVLDSGASHNNVMARYVYQGGAWIFQYSINQLTLSQAQVNAINSGITSAMVSKINGIAAGAEANVQSDWNETDTGSDAYIKNKPDKAITFSDSGNGAASGSTFDGSAARTLSYNSIGAASSSHTHSEYATTAETLSLAQYFKFISSIRSGTIKSVTLSQYSGNLYRGSSTPAYNAITIYELVAPSGKTIVNVDTHRSSHDVFLVPLWSRQPYTVIVACCSFNSLSPQGWYFYATCI